LAEFVWVDGDTLGTVVCLVDPYQAVSQLKHVVTQADDDELGILGPLLDRVEAEAVKVVHKHTDRDAEWERNSVGSSGFKHFQFQIHIAYYT